MIALTSTMFLCPSRSKNYIMSEYEHNAVAANIAADLKEIKNLKSKLRKIGKGIMSQRCLYTSKQRGEPPCPPKMPICQSCLLKMAYKEIMKNG